MGPRGQRCITVPDFIKISQSEDIAIIRFFKMAAARHLGFVCFRNSTYPSLVFAIAEFGVGGEKNRKDNDRLTSIKQCLVDPFPNTRPT